MQALHPETTSEVAVLLNANAKKVTQRVRSAVERQCSGMDVYYSRSLEEARFITQRMLDEKYRFILTGGGDGTIVQTINQLFRLTHRIPTRSRVAGEDRHLQQVPAHRPPLPALGVLKLGTGNALAAHIGAGRVESDISRIRAWIEAGVDPCRLELPLIETEGEVFPFGGMGWDAAVLNDYNRLKDSATSEVSRAVVKSLLGYLAAAFFLTVPQVAMRRAPEVEVRTLGEARLLGPDGTPAREFGRGALLYRGPVHMLAFATIPFYGYRFTMFPFATRLTNTFQLRVAFPGIAEVVSHLPGLWKGTYRTPRILDFHCERVTMSFSEPVPFQIAGEARGRREHLTIGMADDPIELVDYRHNLAPIPATVRKLYPTALAPS